MTTDLESESGSVINLTQSAADHVRSMLADPGEHSGKFLRVYVESGGCSGMQYGMVFDEKRPDDLSTSSHGVPVLVDAVSLDYLKGAVIDYSEELTGGGFKITNPKAKTSCGCGKSFEA
jgi:iron-sulfur cluster assembly accessory protein